MVDVLFDSLNLFVVVLVLMQQTTRIKECVVSVWEQNSRLATEEGVDVEELQWRGKVSFPAFWQVEASMRKRERKAQREEKDHHFLKVYFWILIDLGY